MIHNPDILLLDEILSVGDEDFQRRSFRKIREMQIQGKTIFFVSHSADQIKKVCDRVILLKEGQILDEGKPDEVISHYLDLVFEKHREYIQHGIEERNRKTKRLKAELDQIDLELEKSSGRSFSRRSLSKLQRKRDDIVEDLKITRLGLVELVEQAEQIADKRIFLMSDLDFEDRNRSVVEALEKIFSKALECDEDVVSKKRILYRLKFLMLNLINDGSFSRVDQIDPQKIELIKRFKDILFIQFDQYSDRSILKSTFSDLLWAFRAILVLNEEENCPFIDELTRFMLDRIDGLEDNQLKEELFAEYEKMVTQYFEGDFNIDIDDKLKTFEILKERLAGHEDHGLKMLKHSVLKNAIIQALSNEIFRIEERLSRIREGEPGNKNVAGATTELESRRAEMMKKLDQTFLASTVGHEGEQERAGGSGAIEITRVRILDGDLQETTTFPTGSALSLEISYHASRPVEKPMFGIAIHTDDGQVITGPNTTTSKQTCEQVLGDGKVLYRMDSLPLLPGIYRVSVSACDYSGANCYDYHDRLYTFKVINTKIDELYGFIRIPATWEYLDGDSSD
ncbi:Wzt carbohydrate-binding domain-containing protein [Thermodesulfobacteriota bacterium]